jgi:hypothetical protein
MRHRLEESGGRFGFDSHPGQGTKIFFTYDLPQRKKYRKNGHKNGSPGRLKA